MTKAIDELKLIEKIAFDIALAEATPSGLKRLRWEFDFSDGEKYQYLRRAILARASFSHVPAPPYGDAHNDTP